ncbi:glycoside hydrolase family 3 protein [Punctularia strigosozonata HHB-11173 SS5]|uniref:glycoside hydrolase family 3 protein n=1 Tax=Punctularia strigosozonata (strain HHB-11173) TaxID=741275 RepID=UPI0004416465|nr:glycoside hydrolase family 3 protein [Punctularia strigosozonata HHB-11173 SS5]EIN08281.1 glycoside hydrolase family 3 protein [Punctularia strigosozonata HHB-11173 SS5]
MVRSVFVGTLGLLPFVVAQLGSSQWDAAYTKAQAAVTKLSQSDKVNLATGTGVLGGNCTGNIKPIPSIGFPGLCLEDSPLGVRSTDLVSAFPAGINAAATFSRDLIQQRGAAMGQEFRGKGVNVQLGPMMNMMRSPDAGRNWEGFGGDPYLAGEAAFATVTGIQAQGVQACMKHIIANEQEHLRMLETSNVDDRTIHELYLHPFLRSVQANVASAMCSYNQINGTYACENDHILNDLLKTELGFRGYVMSDWFATHSTSTAANRGLDMEMPGGLYEDLLGFFGGLLALANDLGTVTDDRLDEMATRILAGWYLLGQDEGYPAVNFDAHDANSNVNQHVNVQGNHKDIIRTIGAASTVLLKNTGGVLPLHKPRTIGIIGSDAGSNPNGINACDYNACDSGILAMGWGVQRVMTSSSQRPHGHTNLYLWTFSTNNFPYLITPLDAITNRSAQDGTVVTSSLSDTDTKTAASVAAGKDYALVFLSSDSGENIDIIVEGNIGDRNDLNAWHSGDALVEAVAAVNNNTVVVVNSVGPMTVEKWVDHPNVTALVWSGLGGQEAGNSLVDVLYGAYNPSGRLPYTIAKDPDDYAAHWQLALEIDYTEGLFIDYKHFDKAGITPRFEFGFGLSYTTFAYSGLSISGSVGSYTPPTGAGSSLDSSLHEKVFTVTFTVRNNGTVDGHEVPQLYLSKPASANSPPKELKGFDYIALNSGASSTVAIQLSRYDLSIWDVVSQRWIIPNGTFTVSVGASSRDIRLTGTFQV